MTPSRLDALAEAVTDKVTTQKNADLPYVGLEHMAPGSPDLLGTAPSSSSISTNNVFTAGDTLFGKLRPNLRKAVIAPFAGYCSTDILVLRARPGVEPSYLGRLFQSESVTAAAVRTAMGTKMPRTSWAALRGLLVYRPNLGVQRHVAAILDTLDEAIRKTEQLIAKLRQMKQGLLHDLLSRGIDENGALRDPARNPQTFKRTPLGFLPVAWRVLPLGALLAEIYRYPTYYGIQYVARGVAEVRGELLLADGRLEPDPGKYRYISEATAERFPRVRLRPDDFVMSVRGTVGKVGRVPEALDGAVITANLIRLSLNRAEASSRWAHRVLQSQAFQSALALATSATTIKTIQVPALTGILVGTPPLDEQGRIASVAEATDSRLVLEAAALATLNSLKSGLTDDLLTGRVRVSSHETAE